MNDTSGLVATAVLIAVGGAEIGRAVKGLKPTMRPIIGGFLLGILLLIISSINLELGEAFCILVIIAALLTNGATIFAAASKVTAKPKGST